MDKRYLTLLRNSILNLLFPPVCLHCGERITRQDDFICQTCFAKIEFLDPVITKIEGLSYDYLISIAKYREVIVSIIHNLKFYDFSSISDFIAELMYKPIRKLKLLLDENILIDVPLHPIRKKERGYNQASLISYRLANLLDCEYHNDVLVRVSNTISQATLKHEARAGNMEQAFRLNKDIDFNNKTIILLDDVFTTGSTVEECCKALRETNPKRIIVLTLGKA